MLNPQNIRLFFFLRPPRLDASSFSFIALSYSANFFSFSAFSSSSSSFYLAAISLFFLSNSRRAAFCFLFSIYSSVSLGFLFSSSSESECSSFLFPANSVSFLAGAFFYPYFFSSFKLIEFMALLIASLSSSSDSESESLSEGGLN